MSNAVEVNDSDFETQIEQHKGLAVVDFWATWCAPCRMVAPVLDQLAVEYQGKAKVAKVDVDVNIKTSTKFNVRSIPAILFFKDGKLVSAKGVTMEDEQKMLTDFAKHHKVPYRIQTSSDAFANYKIKSIPTIVLIDRKGVVQMVKVGASPAGLKALEAKIKELLDEK